MTKKIDGSRLSFIIAEENKAHLDAIRSSLESRYFKSKIYSAADGREAWMKIQNSKPSLLIVNWNVSKMTAADIIQNILKNRNMAGEVKILLMSDLTPEDTRLSEAVLEKIHFMPIPFKVSALVDIIDSIFYRAHKRKNSLREVILQTGQVLFRQGDFDTDLYILKKGKLAVSKGTEGNEVKFAEISENEFVGEMAFVDGKPRSATVTALEPCELIQIPNNQIDDEIFANPKWAKALVKILSQRLRGFNDREEESDSSDNS